MSEKLSEMIEAKREFVKTLMNTYTKYRNDIVKMEEAADSRQAAIIEYQTWIDNNFIYGGAK